MKKLCGHILCFCCVCGFSYADERQLEDVIEDVNSAVVSIVAESADAEALGAGMVIDAEGYVVTNAHVTDGADKITLTTVDDDAYEAEIVGSDSKTDIALLKTVRPLETGVAHFADSDEIRVGNQVFAIGNPFGLGNSVSLGIISAKERDIEKGPYDNFIQTDAAINQGNSGGPLFNMNGEIIGMNTAIFSNDGNDAGVGFAVPANMVRWVANQLKQNGKVERGWLGIGVQKIRSTDITQKNKLVVASMAENSPAAAAGIKVGDVLEDAGGLSLKSPRQFSLEVAQTAPGTVLPIIVLRDGQMSDLEITVESMPIEVMPALQTNDKTAKTPKLKNNISEATEAAPAANFPELGIKAVFDDVNQEFLIVDIAEDSDAEAKGINVGDRFKTVNDRKVFGVEDLRVRIKESMSRGQISLQFVGEDMLDVITLKLKEQNEPN